MVEQLYSWEIKENEVPKVLYALLDYLKLEVYRRQDEYGNYSYFVQR
jgi:hypothetical protein